MDFFSIVEKNRAKTIAAVKRRISAELIQQRRNPKRAAAPVRNSVPSRLLQSLQKQFGDSRGAYINNMIQTRANAAEYLNAQQHIPEILDAFMGVPDAELTYIVDDILEPTGALSHLTAAASVNAERLLRTGNFTELATAGDALRVADGDAAAADEQPTIDPASDPDGILRAAARGRRARFATVDEDAAGDLTEVGHEHLMDLIDAADGDSFRSARAAIDFNSRGDGSLDAYDGAVDFGDGSVSSDGDFYSVGTPAQPRAPTRNLARDAFGFSPVRNIASATRTALRESAAMERARAAAAAAAEEQQRAHAAAAAHATRLLADEERARSIAAQGLQEAHQRLLHENAQRTAAHSLEEAERARHEAQMQAAAETAARRAEAEQLVHQARERHKHESDVKHNEEIIARHIAPIAAEAEYLERQRAATLVRLIGDIAKPLNAASEELREAFIAGTSATLEHLAKESPGPFGKIRAVMENPNGPAEEALAASVDELNARLKSLLDRASSPSAAAQSLRDTYGTDAAGIVAAAENDPDLHAVISSANLDLQDIIDETLREEGNRVAEAIRDTRKMLRAALRRFEDIRKARKAPSVLLEDLKEEINDENKQAAADASAAAVGNAYLADKQTATALMTSKGRATPSDFANYQALASKYSELPIPADGELGNDHRPVREFYRRFGSAAVALLEEKISYALSVAATGRTPARINYSRGAPGSAGSTSGSGMNSLDVAAARPRSALARRYKATAVDPADLVEIYIAQRRAGNSSKRLAPMAEKNLKILLDQRRISRAEAKRVMSFFQ